MLSGKVTYLTKRIQFRDPVFFNPWIQDGKNLDPGSKKNILDDISKSLAEFLSVLKILKSFVTDPGSSDFLTLTQI